MFSVLLRTGAGRSRPPLAAS
eukprot:COSAG01_NODE_43808_length_426_cov_0.556575_1_plen_20_part_10